jgi:hypothetical protein
MNRREHVKERNKGERSESVAGVLQPLNHRSKTQTVAVFFQKSIKKYQSCQGPREICPDNIFVQVISDHTMMTFMHCFYF